MEVSALSLNCDGGIGQRELVDEENSQFQESSHICSSDLETIFSPVLEPIEVFCGSNINYDAGKNDGPRVSGLGTDDSDDNRSSSCYQTCNVSDFFISDMIIASLPLDGHAVAVTESNPFTDYNYAEPNMLFDVADEYMTLPFLEDTANSGNTIDVKSHEVATTEPDNGSLYLAINQMKPFNQESDVNANSDQAEHFDPQLFIKYLPELSDVSNFSPQHH